jgi:hypothetical protein
MKERAEETAVIFKTWKSIRVNAVAVGFVVLLGARVIDKKGIRIRCSRGAANDDAIHSVGLMFGTGEISIFSVMKVAQREQRDPSVFVVANAMNKEKG